MLNSGVQSNPTWDAGCGCHRFPLMASEGEGAPQEVTETSGGLCLPRTVSVSFHGMQGGHQIREGCDSPGKQEKG